MSKKELKPMRHVLRDLMRETHLPVSQVVADTGISNKWWYIFLSNEEMDTASGRAEMLIEYLKKNRPRKRRVRG